MDDGTLFVINSTKPSRDWRILCLPFDREELYPEGPVTGNDALMMGAKLHTIVFENLEESIKVEPRVLEMCLCRLRASNDRGYRLFNLEENSQVILHSYHMDKFSCIDIHNALLRR